jgi:hypothetical protein
LGLKELTVAPIVLKDSLRAEKNWNAFPWVTIGLMRRIRNDEVSR